VGPFGSRDKAEEVLQQVVSAGASGARVVAQ
jgi:hypothetical protein